MVDGAPARGRVVVRAARVEEAPRLTEIAVRAKRHWGYPEAWIDLWRDELAVTPEYLARGTAFTASCEGRLVGITGASVDDGRWWIDHMWVDPEAMGVGAGAALLAALVDAVRREGAERLVIVSDPHAEGFYVRHGAVRTGEVPSTPAGRMLPVLELEV